MQGASSWAGQELGQSSELGRLIDRKYRLVRKLGAGGSGVVYEAVNESIGSTVAIKMLLPDVATGEAAARFVREGRTVGQLIHRNIVRVYDQSCDENGSMYLVQEFLQGEALAARLKEGRRLPLKEALAIILPVLDAIDFAHNKDVVHRDLNPNNIFLAKNFDGKIEPKVIDFGIAKLLREGVSGMPTRVGAVLGTPGYLSPEQARAESVDRRTDLWCAAAVLYAMLAGAPPFLGEYQWLVCTLAREEAPDVRTRAPNVPEDVARVLARALAREKAGRYASAREFADALRSCGRRARWKAALGVAAGVAVLALAGVAVSVETSPARAPVVAQTAPRGAPPVVTTPMAAAPAPAPAHATTVDAGAGAPSNVTQPATVGPAPSPQLRVASGRRRDRNRRPPRSDDSPRDSAQVANRMGLVEPLPSAPPTPSPPAQAPCNTPNCAPIFH